MGWGRGGGDQGLVGSEHRDLAAHPSEATEEECKPGIAVLGTDASPRVSAFGV